MLLFGGGGGRAGPSWVFRVVENVCVYVCISRSADNLQDSLSCGECVSVCVYVYIAD